MAVCQMNAGQQSLIRCCSDYGFSSTRRPAIVPIDAPLFFLVRVLRWEKEKNLHEMSLADKFEYADRRRQCGKELFAGNKPLSAARQYDKAITALESVRNHEVEMKTVQQKNELVTLFLVNQAQSEQNTGQQWQRRIDADATIEELTTVLYLRRFSHPRSLLVRVLFLFLAPPGAT